MALYVIKVKFSIWQPPSLACEQNWKIVSKKKGRLKLILFYSRNIQIKIFIHQTYSRHVIYFTENICLLIIYLLCPCKISGCWHLGHINNISNLKLDPKWFKVIMWISYQNHKIAAFFEAIKSAFKFWHQ